MLLRDPLLVRSNGGMELTRRAEELAQPLERWHAMTLALLESSEFDPLQLDRRFRVASTDFGVLSVISPTLPLLAEAAPGVRIEVAPFTPDMAKKLAAGELDLIVTGHEPDLSIAHARHLFSETLSCVVRADHPLSVGDADAPLALEAYLDWPHIAISIGDGYDHVQASLGASAARRNVIARVPYFYAAPDLVGSSDAILTLPTRAAQKFAAAHGFRRRPAPEQIPGFDYWALWHERSARDRATLWLVELLVAACDLSSDA